MKTILRTIPFLLIISMAACAPTAVTGSADVLQGPAAWIDAPLNNSNLPQAETQVVSHASDPSGISSFELSIDGNVFHTDAVAADQAGNTLAHISQAWLPGKPGVYMLSVRAANKADVYGPYAYAQVMVGRVTDTPSVSPTPIDTAMAVASLTPIDTATTTSTPTPTALLAIGLVNTNCHDGPGTVYHISDLLMKGQSVLIDGISQDKTWVRVLRPDGSNLHCWLYLPSIQVAGSLDGLHTYLALTLTPTITPIPVSTLPPADTPIPPRSSPTR